MDHEPSATTQPATSWIGRPVRRREDVRFLQGQARYVDDLTPPAVTNVRDALAGTARLHDAAEDNVLIRMSRGAGDVEAAFRSADRVVRERFHLPRVVAAPMEPRGVVAAYDRPTDLLTLWISAQDPYRPRAQVGRALGRPEDRIRVVVPDVGGAFGSKGNVPPEAILAAWLAVKTARPVKWIEDRRENFMAANQGRGIDAEVEVAVDGRGKITALRGTVTADVGAYLDRKSVV